LLADWEDIVPALGILIPIVIWIASQVLGGDKAPPGGGKPQAARPRPKPVQAKPRNEEFRDEIEAFLKKASEKRGQPQGDAQAARNEAARNEAARQAEAPAARREPPRRPARAPGRPQPRPAGAAESRGPVMAEAVRPLGEEDLWAGDVAQHVQQHISDGGFKDRASQLGESVGQSDERLESHLHAKFDHKVGQLDDSPLSATSFGEPSASRKAPPPQAQAIVRMLSSPLGVRQAILIGEILKRPELE
jgi:hypothetical protein